MKAKYNSVAVNPVTSMGDSQQILLLMFSDWIKIMRILGTMRYESDTTSYLVLARALAL